LAVKIFGIVTFLLFAVNCSTTDPPPPPDGDNPELTIVLEDVSCTEAWIKLTTTDLQLPTSLTIKQNDITKDTINLSSADKLLYIDSLLPNRNYLYQASSSEHQASSNKLSITTMDTTSHEFTWQTFTFGEAGGSALYDVAIIDENNIWAVGEIYMLDSLGNPDPEAYNAVHWDGSEWELKRILYDGGSWTIRTIFAFNSNDIWFSGFVRYDGQNFIELTIPPILMGWTINKLWGTSSNEIYIVGDNGNICWYNGTRWTRIESGTETIINDIWGITDDSNELILYCPVSSFFVPGEKKILKITDNVVDSVSWVFDRRLYSVWSPREGFLYVCGEGVFENKFNVWRKLNTPLVGTNSVRGNNINDIVVAGDNGFITHFNGVEWKTLSTYSSKGYAEVSFKDEIVAICGNYQGQGLIEIGKRN